MSDEERAEYVLKDLSAAAVDLCKAADVALRHLGRELEPILSGVEDWITDGRYCKGGDDDVDTTDAWQ